MATELTFSSKRVQSTAASQIVKSMTGTNGESYPAIKLWIGDGDASQQEESSC
jgi:hypothetical protein